MINFGYDEATIKTELNLTKGAYDTWLNDLEHSTESYLNYLAKIGHISTMVETLQSLGKDIRIQEGIRNLAVKSLEKDPDNLKRVYSVTHANICLSKMRTEAFELQGKTPLAAAFRQFVKKNIVEAGGKGRKDHSNNLYNLPVLPEELGN